MKLQRKTERHNTSIFEGHTGMGGNEAIKAASFSSTRVAAKEEGTEAPVEESEAEDEDGASEEGRDDEEDDDGDDGEYIPNKSSIKTRWSCGSVQERKKR